MNIGMSWWQLVVLFVGCLAFVGGSSMLLHWLLFERHKWR
jgi:hypothetical protein